MPAAFTSQLWPTKADDVNAGLRDLRSGFQLPSRRSGPLREPGGVQGIHGEFLDYGIAFQAKGGAGVGVEGGDGVGCFATIPEAFHESPVDDKPCVDGVAWVDGGAVIASGQ